MRKIIVSIFLEKNGWQDEVERETAHRKGKRAYEV